MLVKKTGHVQSSADIKGGMCWNNHRIATSIVHGRE